jgi:hypothetical protein
MEYNEDGSHTRDIPVSGQPFVLAGIDSERIAVTHNFNVFNIFPDKSVTTIPLFSTTT